MNVMKSLWLMQNRIWRAPFLVALMAVATALCMPARAQSAKPRQAARVPVLVELFTSEGCSDCPPADQLLERLDKEQFVPGADAIVLSEHVTYWNRLGWRDPFSLDLADVRQDNYGRQFGLSSVYTPQAVVDGAWEFVGSDEAKMREFVAEGAAAPKKLLTIGGAHFVDGAVEFTVKGDLDAKDRLYAIAAADATVSEVARGENAGRTLHHVAVVRAMKEFGGADADGRVLKMEAGGADGARRLVVFAIDRKTNHVIAAAEQELK
jgi:hypothetical protein